MLNRILIAFFGVTAGLLLSLSLTTAYFQYRTGMPLWEILEVKDKCEAARYQHCNLLYYFVPDSAVWPLPLEPLPLPETSDPM